MTNFKVMDGSPKLKEHEVRHILLPGRGRDKTGFDLSPRGRERTLYAARFFTELRLKEAGGVIVPSGKYSPGDKVGYPWFDYRTGKTFRGKPEAYITEVFLEHCGIMRENIRPEPFSIDTVTNLTRAENGDYFPDGDPVAIFAQEKQLERIIEDIAPKTLRRQYLGIIVPELVEEDYDSPMAKAASKIISFGISPNMKHIVGWTDGMARAVWFGANVLSSFHNPIDSYPLAADSAN